MSKLSFALAVLDWASILASDETILIPIDSLSRVDEAREIEERFIASIKPGKDIDRPRVPSPAAQLKRNRNKRR